MTAQTCGTISNASARALWPAAVAAVLALGAMDAAEARMGAASTVATLTRSAAHVFRGRCASVAVGTVAIAGARLPTTTYTFHVDEHLKGKGTHTLTFRQVGTPEGGPRDLGRLVGLPHYAPGTDYVLFLLPPGHAGMTSPAGAAEGAFVVRGDRLISVHDDPEARAGGAAIRARGRSPSSWPASYEELRRTVLDEVKP